MIQLEAKVRYFNRRNELVGPIEISVLPSGKKRYHGKRPDGSVMFFESNGMALKEYETENDLVRRL